MNTKEKIKFILPFVGIFVFAMLLGFSFAYYKKASKQEGTNTASTLTCLSTTLTDATSAINLTGEYAIGNVEGMSKTPYTFTLTNSCTNWVRVAINFEDLSTSTIDATHMRVSLNTGSKTYSNGALLSNFVAATAVNTGATAYNLVDSVYLSPNESKSFDLRVWIDEATTSAQGLNKVFNGKISIQTYAEDNYSTDAEHFAWLHSGETYNNGGGLKSIMQPATTQLRKTREYRYYGANPDNYVSFNDELWRMIGVFEVENSSGILEYRYKLIRNESIGSYSWDSSDSSINEGYGINEWSQADAMKLMNPGYESESVGGSLYWNGTSGTCYNDQSNATTSCDFTTKGIKTNFKSLIDNAKYYLAGTSTVNTSSFGYYSAEKGSIVMEPGTNCTSTLCNDNISRNTSWIGNIGLVYSSDYGYATNEELCGRNTLLFLYNSNNDCYQNDWINNSDYQWALFAMVYGDRGDYGAIITSYGHVGSGSCSSKRNIRPVLYLKSSVSIASGTGTQTDPYILS